MEASGKAYLCAILTVARKTAERLSYPEPDRLVELARRFYHSNKLRQACDVAPGAWRNVEWAHVATTLDRMLEEAVAAGTVPELRVRRGTVARVGAEGWHEAAHQDDDGFFRRGRSG